MILLVVARAAVVDEEPRNLPQLRIRRTERAVDGDLIDQLVAAERAPTETRLDLKQESVTAELSLFGQIQSAVTDLRLPSRNLANPDTFNQLNLVKVKTRNNCAGFYILIYLK